jgi:hypothetical protein
MAIEHHPALMVGAALVLASERRRGPNPEKRGAPPGGDVARRGFGRAGPWSPSPADPSRYSRLSNLQRRSHLGLTSAFAG